MDEGRTIEHEGVTYTWHRCIHDFAGNNSQSGFWSDVWKAEDGSIAVTCGGAWIEYFPSFRAKDKEMNARLNTPWGVDRAVAIEKHVWESFSYPHPLVGNEARKMIDLIGNATQLGDAINYLESLSTYEETELVFEAQEP